MKVIHKYGLASSGRWDMSLPKGAKVLAVASQRNEPQLWALIDPSKDDECRQFMVVPTGRSFDAERVVYIGTIQLDDGQFVGHVFELI